MNITDILLKYRSPLFAPADEGGGDGGSAPAGDAPAGADDAPGKTTALGGDGEDPSSDDKPDDDKPGGEADDDKGDDKGDDKDKDEAGDDAPAEFKLTAPEGMEDFQGDMDTFSSEATDWMKENPKATPAEALSWAANRQANLISTQSSEVAEAFTKQIDSWEGEAKADKDIGGDNFDANLGIAKKAIDTFGDESLKAILNESGLGSHPAVIKFAVNAGKALSDAPVIKTNDGTAKKTLAQSLYGDKA